MFTETELKIIAYKNVLKPELKKLATKYKIAGRSSMKANDLYGNLYIILTKKKIEKDKFKSEVYKKLRANRRVIMDKGIVLQESVKPIPKLYLSPSYLLGDKYFTYVNQNIGNILEEFIKTLYKINSNVIKGNIKLKYIVIKPDINKKTKEFIHFIKHTKAVPFDKNYKYDSKKFMTADESSDDFLYWIGYNLSVQTKKSNTNKDGVAFNKITLANIKAFAPNNDIKYHEMTCASTGDSRICIYETFMDVTGKIELRYMRDNKKKLLLTRLKDEGDEIYKCVINGELIKSLELLTTKYENEVNICFFNNQMYIDENDTIQLKEKLINVNKGVTKYINDDKDIIDLTGTKIFLYSNNHVAPSKFEIRREKDVKKIIKKIEGKFVLKPIELKKSSNIKGVLGFDLETYLDKNHKCNMYNITIYGHIDNETIKKSYYGKDCLKEFISYINEIKTPMNNKKTRSKTKIPTIHIYGFNNSRFDNLFIFNGLHELEPNMEIIFTGNAVKYMRFNNIKIYDISCQYNAGSLRNTCKQFGLEMEKGIFPYNFVNEDNLYYDGEAPEKKYWNNENEYSQYIEKENNKFNMKEYTEKYCLLDSQLVYELAKIHLKSCVGEINGKKYNVTSSMTSANIALKMFCQVFLNEKLYQSPDKIIEKEKLAYKGGRTEKFKKSFKVVDGKRLNYYDINSAYPAGMTKMMPYKYIKTIIHDNYVVKNINELTEYNLYEATCEYKIKNKTDHFISNLLTRKDGVIISTANTDKGYHWGIELIEAINNGCKITLFEENMYEGKQIFKEFAEYFYNKRLEIKKTNPSLSLFFKNILNSLYGKFGQKKFNKSKLVNNSNEAYEIINGDTVKMVSFELVGDKLLIEYEEAGDEYDSIGKLVRFSSYISSTARSKLSEFMRDVGHETVYYCDTDSVFTTGTPNANLLSNVELGKWKKENESPINKAIFIAPKCYYYETENKEITKKAKGVDAKTLKVQDYEDLNNNTKSSVSQTKKMFFRSLTEVLIKDQERNINIVDNKRIWNGNESTPFNNINDWVKAKE